MLEHAYTYGCDERGATIGPGVGGTLALPMHRTTITAHSRRHPVHAQHRGHLPYLFLIVIAVGCFFCLLTGPCFIHRGFFCVKGACFIHFIEIFFCDVAVLSGASASPSWLAKMCKIWSAASYCACPSFFAGPTFLPSMQIKTGFF